MQELEVDFGDFGEVFSTAQTSPFTVIEIDSDQAAAFAERLGVPVRRCYISDAALKARVQETSTAAHEIVGSKFPDRGSTMAGDFGEILTALFHASREHPAGVLDPKKWRLKQDRTKPAPGSDVVQMILPNWPASSTSDRIICAEVKTKSTNGASTPIQSAIADSEKDSSRRFVKTLNWLKERALDTGLSTISIEQLDRFIHPVDHPEATREFRAVAVICASLVADELVDVVAPPAEERALIVISVPNLKDNYERVFGAAMLTADDFEGDV
ncbi:Hachiman antiphage defense system protein HamA [Microbacterium oleivorans]|uniref:Hachiman antiphage defense system protein HamA n=1 Tax=Microbacterium oleivorans TaxID=273677 RepID=UPI000767B04B|nr:Hachiman antiphage defense system protein HamA [Microbacterium oleivorans]